MKFENAIDYVGDNHGPSQGALVNIIFRFILNLGAAMACWIPMNLFHKNGEFAGTAMIIAIAVLNFFYAINAVVWPNNDIASWTKGYGWCDIQLILWVPLETLNAAAVCAVMQNIADQVAIVRASGLTGQERRRKHIIQAFIILPVPMLQIILYYFVIAMRYNISGIIGCQAVFDPDWVFLVFFILPCPMFAISAAYFAALTWWRYRQINAVSRRALWCSSNYGAQTRNAKTRRRLYFMALTIVAPYCPMQMVFLFNNISLGMPWSKPYNLDLLHASGWDRLDYSPSTSVSFTSMYINYIAVLEVAVFFAYFGHTKEAYKMYRKYLRALGLNKIFPKLNEEWHPSDRPTTSMRSMWPRTKSDSSFATSVHRSSSSTQGVNTRPKEWPLHDDDDTQILNIGRLHSLDLEAARADINGGTTLNMPQHSYRSPWLFFPTFVPSFGFPKMPVPALLNKKHRSIDESPCQSSPRPLTDPLNHPQPYSPKRQDNTRLSGEFAHERTRGSDGGLTVQWASNSPTAKIVGDSTLSYYQSKQENPAFPAGAHMATGETLDLFDHGHILSIDVAELAKRRADFEKGLVSIKRDFSSE